MPRIEPGSLRRVISSAFVITSPSVLPFRQPNAADFLHIQVNQSRCFPLNGVFSSLSSFDLHFHLARLWIGVTQCPRQSTLRCLPCRQLCHMSLLKRKPSSPSLPALFKLQIEQNKQNSPLIRTCKKPFFVHFMAAEQSIKQTQGVAWLTCSSRPVHTSIIRGVTCSLWLTGKCKYDIHHRYNFWFWCTNYTRKCELILWTVFLRFVW